MHRHQLQNPRCPASLHPPISKPALTLESEPHPTHQWADTSPRSTWVLQPIMAGSNPPTSSPAPAQDQLAPHPSIRKIPVLRNLGLFSHSPYQPHSLESSDKLQDTQDPTSQLCQEQAATISSLTPILGLLNLATRLLCSPVSQH